MGKYLIVVWKWDLVWKDDNWRTTNTFIDFINKGNKRFEVKVEEGNDGQELKFIGYTKYNSFKAENKVEYSADEIKQECIQILSNDNNQVLILLHQGTPDNFNEDRRKELLKDLVDKKIKARLFYGGTGKLYEDLIDRGNTLFLKVAIIDPLDENNFKVKRQSFQSVWDWYWNKLELENQKKEIIKLWLPLVIDIQGLSEVEVGKRESYLKDIFVEISNDNFIKNLNDGWNEVKKILLPPKESEEVLDKNYRLKTADKEKVKLPMEEITTGNLKKFVEENCTKKNEPNFLPSWLHEVVRILDRNIKKSK